MDSVVYGKHNTIFTCTIWEKDIQLNLEENRKRLLKMASKLLRM